MPGEVSSSRKLRAAVAPMDFGVSMRREVFEHKLNDGLWRDGRHCYWTFPRGVPKGTGPGSRMWVANGGRWVGYFIICDEPCDDSELTFFSDSFVRVDAGERRPFMGYTLTVPKRGGSGKGGG